MMIMRVAKFKKQLTISMKETTYNTVKEIADQKEVSLAEIVRDFVEKQLEKIQDNNK